MSYIEIKSEELVQLCTTAIQNIMKKREWLKEYAIYKFLEEKNSGLYGWLRRVFKKQYDREKALEYLMRKADYESFHWTLSACWRAKEVIDELMDMAQRSESVNVSRQDYNSLLTAVKDPALPDGPWLEDEEADEQ